MRRSLTCLDFDTQWLGIGMDLTGHDELFASLPNVRCVRDERERGGPIPLSSRELSLMWTTRRDRYLPLQIRELELLLVEPPTHDTFEYSSEIWERDVSQDLRTWPDILAALCAEVSTIDRLHLVLPVMSPCSYYKCRERSSTIPNLPDFLGQPVPNSKALELDVPWCSPESGHLRSDHWVSSKLPSLDRDDPSIY
jgi:hypothetical protein